MLLNLKISISVLVLKIIVKEIVTNYHWLHYIGYIIVYGVCLFFGII